MGSPENTPVVPAPSIGQISEKLNVLRSEMERKKQEWQSTKNIIVDEIMVMAEGNKKLNDNVSKSPLLGKGYEETRVPLRRKVDDVDWNMREESESQKRFLSDASTLESEIQTQRAAPGANVAEFDAMLTELKNQKAEAEKLFKAAQAQRSLKKGNINKEIQDSVIAEHGAKSSQAEAAGDPYEYATKTVLEARAAATAADFAPKINEIRGVVNEKKTTKMAMERLNEFVKKEEVMCDEVERIITDLNNELISIKQRQGSELAKFKSNLVNLDTLGEGKTLKDNLRTARNMKKPFFANTSKFEENQDAKIREAGSALANLNRDLHKQCMEIRNKFVSEMIKIEDKITSLTAYVGARGYSDTTEDWVTPKFAWAAGSGVSVGKYLRQNSDLSTIYETLKQRERIIRVDREKLVKQFAADCTNRDKVFNDMTRSINQLVPNSF